MFLERASVIRLPGWLLAICIATVIGGLFWGVSEKNKVVGKKRLLRGLLCAALAVGCVTVWFPHISERLPTWLLPTSMLTFIILIPVEIAGRIAQRNLEEQRDHPL